MRNRLELQSELVDLLGSKNVYFQPSTNIKLTYPCVIYELQKFDDRFANDSRYITYQVYQITHVYQRYQNNLQEKFRERFQFIEFNNSSKIDGLYQDVYTLYY